VGAVSVTRNRNGPIIDRFSPGVASAIGAAPYLTSFPESLDPSPWPDTRRFRQPAAPARPLPEWWPTGSDRPLVYVTFGTVLGTLPEAASIYRTARTFALDGPLSRIHVQPPLT